MKNSDASRKKKNNSVNNEHPKEQSYRNKYQLFRLKFNYSFVFNLINICLFFGVWSDGYFILEMIISFEQSWIRCEFRFRAQANLNYSLVTKSGKDCAWENELL